MALIGVLVVVLVGSIIALLAGGGANPNPTNSSQTPTDSPTPTPTPTATAGPIVLDDYKGKPAADVVSSLRALGYTNVTSKVGVFAVTPELVGTVYDIKPVGPMVPLVTPIVVTYFDNVPIKPQRVYAEMNEAFDRDTIFVSTIGLSQIAGAQFLHVYGPRQWINCGQAGPLGWTVPDRKSVV